MADVLRDDHDFDRGNAAGNVRSLHQAHRNNGAQHGGQLQADLTLLVGRKDGDGAVNGLDRVQCVQGAENQMTGFGRHERRLDGFQVAHFSDQDHVRILA